MAHGDGHEHEHSHLEELHAGWLEARRAWRVRLRVHLEEPGPDGHGVTVGRQDPARLHRGLHNPD